MSLLLFVTELNFMYQETGQKFPKFDEAEVGYN